jgi:LytS/YehU family sensor histidine kinase
MKKSATWVHIAGWLCLYCFWLLIFQNRTFTLSRTLTTQFCYLVFIAANYYYNFYLIVPRLLYQRKYLSFALSMAAGIIVTAVLRVPLAMYMLHQQPWAVFYSSLLNIAIWTVCIVAGKLVLDRFRFQQYMDDLENAKIKAELDFLNAQFNPHFLFNSIHSIYAHIDKRNSTARNMLLKFSEMLRYQLYECNTKHIPIEKELGYIKNYVSLQQVRKESSLIVNLTIDDDVKGFPIAPLLFISFIENAFKYVSDRDDRDNKIDIRFRKRDNYLLFTCANTRDEAPRTGSKGIGISNVKRRMALLYPDRHDLDILENGDIYEVKLKLQLI